MWAANLLGLDPLDAAEPTPLDLPDEGAAAAEIVNHQAALIAEEIAYLEGLCVTLAARDDEERASAAAGNGLDRTIKLFRRYQAAAKRELEQATALLEQYRVEDQKPPDEEAGRVDECWLVENCGPLSEAEAEKAGRRGPASRVRPGP